MIYEGSLGSDKVLSPEIQACGSEERGSFLGGGGLRRLGEYLHLDPFGSMLSSWLTPATASSAAWEVGRGAKASTTGVWDAGEWEQPCDRQRHAAWLLGQ